MVCSPWQCFWKVLSKRARSITPPWLLVSQIGAQANRGASAIPGTLSEPDLIAIDSTGTAYVAADCLLLGIPFKTRDTLSNAPSRRLQAQQTTLQTKNKLCGAVHCSMQLAAHLTNKESLDW